MTGLRLALSAAATLVLTAPLAVQAQSFDINVGSGGNEFNRDTVTCESQDGRQRECRSHAAQGLGRHARAARRRT